MTTIWRRTRKPPTRRLRLRRRTEAGQNAKRKCQSKTEIACGSTTGDFFWRMVSATASAPHLFGNLDHHAQLRPLFFLGEHVAFLGGSEAALRREAELVEGGPFGRLVDAAL